MESVRKVVECFEREGKIAENVAMNARFPALAQVWESQGERLMEPVRKLVECFERERKILENVTAMNARIHALAPVAALPFAITALDPLLKSPVVHSALTGLNPALEVPVVPSAKTALEAEMRRDRSFPPFWMPAERDEDEGADRQPAKTISDHQTRRCLKSILLTPPASRADASISNGGDRRAAVDAYIDEVLRLTGKRITRTDIWKFARYKSRTEFERWERNDAKRPNKAAHERFTRILTEKPHLRSVPTQGHAFPRIAPR
jgi:hypothetical protein